MLLKNKADPNIGNHRGDTVLHYVAKFEHCEYNDYFDLLLQEEKLDINALNFNSATPLTYAVISNKLDNALILIKAG